MRVSRSNVCGDDEPLWKVKEMGKKSFMEWQNFCGVIAVSGFNTGFPGCGPRRGSFSGLCRERYEWLSK